MFRRRRARPDEQRQLWQNAMRVTATAAEPSLDSGAAPAVSSPGRPMPPRMAVGSTRTLGGKVLRQIPKFALNARLAALLPRPGQPAPCTANPASLLVC